MKKSHLILVLLASIFAAAPVFADSSTDGSSASTAASGTAGK